MRVNNDPTWDGNSWPEYPDVHEGLLRIGLSAALSFFLASFWPMPLVPLMMHYLLLISASASGVSALLRGESPFAPVFTRWDDAAILLLASMLAFRLVEPEAIEPFLTFGDHVAGVEKSIYAR